MSYFDVIIVVVGTRYIKAHIFINNCSVLTLIYKMRERERERERAPLELRKRHLSLGGT